MNNIIILIVMIFCHIVDDYYLQGILASMKQRGWWKDKNNQPVGRKYKYDYLMALFMHSFSWAFMIMLPLLFTGNFVWWIFPINLAIHFVTDHLKANMKKINLIEDQLIHICQILLTWLICVIWF